eukprot:SM000021S06516  [mRNA]  locus=s21:968322:972348:+ [translate_table: standard]
MGSAEQEYMGCLATFSVLAPVVNRWRLRGGSGKLFSVLVSASSILSFSCKRSGLDMRSKKCQGDHAFYYLSPSPPSKWKDDSRRGDQCDRVAGVGRWRGGRTPPEVESGGVKGIRATFKVLDKRKSPQICATEGEKKNQVKRKSHKSGLNGKRRALMCTRGSSRWMSLHRIPDMAGIKQGQLASSLKIPQMASTAVNDSARCMWCSPPASLTSFNSIATEEQETSEALEAVLNYPAEGGEEHRGNAVEIRLAMYHAWSNSQATTRDPAGGGDEQGNPEAFAAPVLENSAEHGEEHRDAALEEIRDAWSDLTT